MGEIALHLLFRRNVIMYSGNRTVCPEKVCPGTVCPETVCPGAVCPQ